MIGYTMVGTTDLDRAKAFYDPLLAQMGLTPSYEAEQIISWGCTNDETVAQFCVCYPFDGQPASVGNGTMTAFRLDTASKVDHLYALAMAQGARDEGKPGFRPEAYGDRFYVAYIRDPDGNKLAFACYDGKANP